MKRVIITGGSGQMGRALTADLAKDGYEIIILSRNPEKVEGLPANARAVKWDGRTDAGWGELVNGAYAIVNLAGENIGIPPVPWYFPGRKQRILESRVCAGQAVTQAIRNARVKPRVLIQPSGINYYGARGDKVTTEKDTSGEDFAALVCVQWEASTKPVEEMSVRRVVMRVAPNMTYHGDILPYLTLPFKLFTGGPLGSGKQWFSWVHTVDVVRAIRFFMENENTRGVYNVSSPDPRTNADFGRLIAKTLHRPYWFPVPAFIMKLIFGELGDSLLLASQRVVPERLQREGFEFRFPNAETALKDLLTNGK